MRPPFLTTKITVQNLFSINIYTTIFFLSFKNLYIKNPMLVDDKKVAVVIGVSAQPRLAVAGPAVTSWPAGRRAGVQGLWRLPKKGDSPSARCPN